MELDGKTAIVTGGSSGIGRAIADAYVDAGADVVIANRTASEGEAAAGDLGCRFVQTDVSEYAQVESLVEATVDEWEQVVSIDLDGVMYGTKTALPHLMESEGSIVNTASIYGLVGGKGAAAYSAAKGGVVNFTQQVAVDYADDGVRVNSICPGFVETPMTKPLLETERFYNYVKGETPMNRPAQPAEIAPMAVFLASDHASYITGANIPIDGGWTAH